MSAERPAATRPASVASLLSQAAWAADDLAESTAENGEVAKSREWKATAAEIRRVWDMALSAARPKDWVRSV